MRLRMLDQFKSGSATYLIASMRRARPDIPAVSHVFNFDVPTYAEDYVYRIGARAEQDVLAPLSCWRQAKTRKVEAIEALIVIPRLELDGMAMKPEKRRWMAGERAQVAVATRR